MHFIVYNCIAAAPQQEPTKNYFNLNQTNNKMIDKQYLEPNAGFSQTVIVHMGNIKTIYISGQIGEGHTLETQTIACFNNLEKQLFNCKATFQDVVKMNTYIVNFTPQIDLPIFRKIRKEFLGHENYPASTLVGVSILGNQDWLIEIEAIAVINESSLVQ